MSPDELKSSLSASLGKITDLFTSYPQESRGMVLASGDKAMEFVAANPISACDIAETDADVTSLQASSVTFFVDARDTTLWDKSTGGWVSSGYTGESSFLRPNTLTYSPWSSKMFYCDEFMRILPVNLNEEPTPV